MVGPGYFSSLGIPLMQGREITQRDAPSSTAVCVINNAFAKAFFAGRNPIGKHVTNSFGDDKRAFEIVGVARDSRDHSLKDKVLPREFVSLLQGKFGNEVSRRATYEVRLGMDSGSALTQLKNVVLGVNRDLDVETQFLSKSIGDQVSQERLLANLVTLFGGLALLLAAIGIYGILAYGVSQRTSEIGVRIAIGAGTGDVVKLIARDTVWMVAGGLAVGLLCSYFLTRLVQSKLFGVTATDPTVGISAVLILVMIALFAAAVPALRASRIDPAIALRDE
jgi:ABC-type antimicrobial peptide transport system permease subunit